MDFRWDGRNLADFTLSESELLRLTPESAVCHESETTAEFEGVALGYSELLIEAIVLRLVEGVLN